MKIDATRTINDATRNLRIIEYAFKVVYGGGHEKYELTLSTMILIGDNYYFL